MLGNAYGGDVGRELGHLVVYLSPWMVAWVGFAVTFPLVFVAEKRWTLIPLARRRLRALHPARARPAGALGAAGHRDRARHRRRFVIAPGLMAAISPRTLAIAALGLARLALAVGAAARSRSAGSRSCCSPLPAALLGVVVYAALIFAIRSLGLSEAWTYVRGLH